MKKSIQSIACLTTALFCLFGASCTGLGGNSTQSEQSVSSTSSSVPAQPKEIDFSDNVFYTQVEAMETAPVTMEAWVQMNTAESSGVIIGNLGWGGDSFGFGVDSGSPYLQYMSELETSKVYKFGNMKIEAEEFVHLTITRDASLGKVYCYINGELKGEGDFQVADFENLVPAILGGDEQRCNNKKFNGLIHSIALYSDYRLVEEVQENMDEVDVSDEDLIAYYDLEMKGNDEIILDQSGNGYDVVKGYMWADLEEPKDYDYSIALVGDTQIIARSYSEHMDTIYSYIVDTAEDKNVQHVLGLGDITDKDTDKEWKASMEAIAKMDGVVPYSLVRGNHDGTSQFNSYVGNSNYNRQYKDKYGSGYQNTVHEFRVDGLNYLIITLDYGATDDVLAWANEVVEAHPNYNVIISTHAYLNYNGTHLDSGDYYAPTNCNGNSSSNNGDDLWNELVSLHENIVMVVCGHISTEYVVVSEKVGVNGNVVKQVLIDPQGMDLSGGMGMVAYFYFSEGGSKVEVQYYSAIYEQHYKSQNHFTFELNVIK